MSTPALDMAAVAPSHHRRRSSITPDEGGAGLLSGLLGTPASPSSRVGPAQPMLHTRGESTSVRLPAYRIPSIKGRPTGRVAAFLQTFARPALTPSRVASLIALSLIALCLISLLPPLPLLQRRQPPSPKFRIVTPVSSVEVNRTPEATLPAVKMTTWGQKDVPGTDKFRKAGVQPDTRPAGPSVPLDAHPAPVGQVVMAKVAAAGPPMDATFDRSQLTGGKNRDQVAQKVAPPARPDLNAHLKIRPVVGERPVGNERDLSDTYAEASVDSPVLPIAAVPVPADKPGEGRRQAMKLAKGPAGRRGKKQAGRAAVAKESPFGERSGDEAEDEGDE